MLLFCLCRKSNPTKLCSKRGILATHGSHQRPVVDWTSKNLYVVFEGWRKSEVPSSSLNIVGTLRITSLTCWIISGSWVCIRNLLPHSPLQKPACIKFSSEFVTRPSTRCADPPTTVLATKRRPVGTALDFITMPTELAPASYK